MLLNNNTQAILFSFLISAGLNEALG